MKTNALLHIARFVLLILAQALVFDNINLFGAVNPYVYVLFILLFPISEGNQLPLLALSFLLGLGLDFFNNTGGMHAAACVTMAYLRPAVLKFTFGVSYEYNTIKVDQTSLARRLTFVGLLVVAHHLVLFSLEAFSISQGLWVLKSTLFSGIFTVALCLILMMLFAKTPS